MQQRLTLAVAVLIGALTMASNAAASVITDLVEQDVYVNLLNPHSYTHNLLDDGFTPGTAVDGTLAIELYDDGQGFIEQFFGLGETALIVVDLFDFDTGDIANASITWTNDLGVNALASINADGMLNVTVSSLGGDFYVGNSTLTVNTQDVPAPATLWLFGLGVAALGAYRRRAST